MRPKKNYIPSCWKFVAGLALLIVFTVGITPKIYFHDWITAHHDHLIPVHCPKEAQLYAYQYTCGFVNTDIDTDPFYCIPAGVPIAPSFYFLLPAADVWVWFHAPISTQSLRGPPVS